MNGERKTRKAGGENVVMNAPLANCEWAKKSSTENGPTIPPSPPPRMCRVLGLNLMWTQRYERKTKRKKHETRHTKWKNIIQRNERIFNVNGENDLRLGNSSAGAKLKLKQKHTAFCPAVRKNQ